MSRCLIPINENYYLIFTMDFDQYDFDKIIMEKIIPLIKQEKEKFVTKKNESMWKYNIYIFLILCNEVLCFWMYNNANKEFYSELEKYWKLLIKLFEL